MQIVSMLTKTGRGGRRKERGAALITTLMMSTLLLTAGGALILTTAMSVTNAYDSTSETQAYYAAEAGLQATLNVLRGNVSPALTYRDAITPANSNAASDPATTAATPWARLSKWLTYDANFPDRVILTTPYSPLSGSAFSSVLTDPDNSAQVSFYTTGVFPTSPGGNKDFITINGTGGNKATITYIPQAATTLSAYPNVASLLGSFQTSVNGGGATIPATPFTLTIHQTAPWAAEIDIICSMASTTPLTNGNSTVDVTFPASGYNLNGALYTVGTQVLRLNPPNTNTGLKTVALTVAAPQPRRILVRVNGYGPRNSRKQMEVMVGRFLFEYTPRSLIAIRSADDGISSMTFDDGSSAAHTYNGYEPAGGTGQAIAAFAVTSAVDAAHLTGLSGTVSGNPRTETTDVSDLSSWLQTADEARRTLNRLEAAAQAQGRYFTTASPPASYGTTTDPAFTFVNGDCNPGGGAGLVVCTGTVTFGGNKTFNGLVLALGDGQIVRNGGGNGVTLGALVVARFDRTAWGGPFLAPTYNTNGGGNSDVIFDPSWVQKALASASRYPIGISEY